MVHYANTAMCGLNRVGSHGDGYSIYMNWFRAYADSPTNQIAYHLYYSKNQETIYQEGVKYVIIDGNQLNANIIDLTPGQDYWFSMRPVEYDPTVIDFLSSLPIAYDDLRFYPTSLLREDMTATQLTIPLLDVEGFPSYGIAKVGVELIQYLAVDTVNKNLIVPTPGNNIPATLVLQSNGKYYLPNSNNVGQGTIDTLSTVGSAPTENWRIICVFVEKDINNITIPETAVFEVQGSISGNIVDGYGNYITWKADGKTVTNGILSFSIIDTYPSFEVDDSFLIQVFGSVEGVAGGRGFNNTPITSHTVSGFDGYSYWNPLVTMIAFQEDNRFDQIYACQSRFEYPNFPFTILDGYNQVLTDILSTDLSAADAANITFPEYDYAGYHRTDPVLLLNGTCVGSYIGGQMGCIDGYGNYNIYRGFSLQDQNTQRQEIKLSVSGRDAILIKRVQTGITCSCYLASSEYQDDRCPFCFVPGTLVRTELGLRPIEQIKVGEKVLSFDGKYHAVSRVFESKYEGNLQSIMSSIGTSPILATPEHPFLTMRGSHKMEMPCGPNSGCKSFISRGDGLKKITPLQLPSGNWLARSQLKGKDRVNLGSFSTKEDAEQAIMAHQENGFVPGHMLDWDDAKNISKDDWLVAKWDNNINDINIIDIPNEFRKNTTLGTQRLGHDKFVVDEEFLWIIGMYLAEGSNNKRSIHFSLHMKETEFSDRIVLFFKKYEYNPSITYNTGDNGNGMCINIHSTTLAQWFSIWLGKLCDNKQIPEEFMKLPHKKTWSLIRGIYDGDGTKRENSITQTSEILALQLVELLHRVGEQPLVYRPSSSNILTKLGNKRKPCYCVSWGEETLNHDNRKGRWSFENQELSRVKEVNKQYYSGNVYNLEVEGDHTYIVQGIVVHNCYGTKFVFGYEQYFNPRISSGHIRVRTSPTAENLKMHEAGLESEFPLDMWTLTVPTIKTRDVIVLFTQAGDEEFRYEVGDVIRNNTILGLDGGQNFKTFRVRKTDPIYQIRIFRDSSDFPAKLNTSLGFAVGLPPHAHEIVISENIMSVAQINQTTAYAQGHNHPIVAGQVIEVLGHTHQIIL